MRLELKSLFKGKFKVDGFNMFSNVKVKGNKVIRHLLNVEVEVNKMISSAVVCVLDLSVQMDINKTIRHTILNI